MKNLITANTRCILLIASFALCQQIYAQTKTVEVTDGQPVEKAVEQLEAIYGLPITYEDTTTVNEGQLEDVTEQIQRTPDPSRRIFRIKLKTLSYSYRLPPSGPLHLGAPNHVQAETKAKVAEALSSVLEGYAAAGEPVTFSVSEEDGIFHVIATDFLNKQGRLEPLTPILDAKITIAAKQRTRIDLFQEICQELTKTTGIEVGGGDFPFNTGSLQAQTVTTISGSNVTARSLLTQLMTELAAPISMDTAVQDVDGQRSVLNRVVYAGGPLSWKLFYGPGWGYMLHIRHVTLEGK
jgi:hypothetical protein